MKYVVSIAVDGRIDVEVEASSFEEAQSRALDEFANADLTEMEVVGRKAVNAEDVDGNFRDF